jgi:hypothetical protein
MALCRDRATAYEDLIVLDLNSLVVVASLLLGLVVGDAVLFSDPVQVQISVPTKLSNTGFTEAAAEQVFAAQVAEMGQALSIVNTPSVHVSSRQTILAALAKPLSLGNVVVAVQNQVGMDVVTVNGVMMEASSGSGLDMMTVVSMPHEAPVQIKLSQPDGDAVALVQRDAVAAMEYVSPYRLALTQFTRGLQSDPTELKRAKDTATGAVARPWVPSRASEQVMLHNLLMLLALLDNDDAEVHGQFALVDAIPNAEPEARGVVELNRSFLDVAAGRAAEAEQHYQSGKRLTATVQLQGWQARVLTLGALVAWSRGELPRTERLLREAIADTPTDVAPHHYLALLLEARGDVAGAAAERAAAAISSRFDIQIPAQPQALYWVDPVHGGIQRRS